MNIRCFRVNPSMSSSLKFLRRTPWARDKVEQFYLLRREQKRTLDALSPDLSTPIG